ncbi:hypothetical protein [Streptomyces sp. NPDC001410]
MSATPSVAAIVDGYSSGIVKELRSLNVSAVLAGQKPGVSLSGRLCLV